MTMKPFLRKYEMKENRKATSVHTAVGNHAFCQFFQQHLCMRGRYTWNNRKIWNTEVSALTGAAIS